MSSAAVPGPVFDPVNNTLLPEAVFAFPIAPQTGGGFRDVAAIAAVADGRHEQATLTLRTGALRITAPRFGRAFHLTWDVADFPHALLWQDYQAPGASFWGACDTSPSSRRPRPDARSMTRWTPGRCDTWSPAPT